MELIPKWKKHPLTLQGYVELLPTDWLYAIRGADVSPQADLKNGRLVDFSKLWEDLIKQGLYDPVIIRVGVNNSKYRLESGNHRIQLFKHNDVAYTPATVQIQAACGPTEANVMTDATHNFNLDIAIDTIALRYGYARPSAVFKELKALVQPF